MRVPKPSPSMVVATTALMVALSGAAYAGVTLSSNSVRSTHIVNGQVKSVDLADGAVRAAKIRNGAVTSLKVRDGAIGLADLSAATRAALGGASGSAGGDLAGSYPNPEIAAGAVGSAELAANEAWRVIGSTGQPAFSGGWSNSPLGVVPFSARFTKDVVGTVHLAGQITGGTISCTAGVGTVFVLPAGYRPRLTGSSASSAPTA